MVVEGAKKTVIHQAFEVQVTTVDGDKMLVFLEPDGTGRVYSLKDEAAARVSKALAPIAATPQDLADAINQPLQRKRRSNGRPG